MEVKTFDQARSAAVPVATITTCGSIQPTRIESQLPTTVASPSQLHVVARGIESSYPSLRCTTSLLIIEFLITCMVTNKMIHPIADRVDRVEVASQVRFREARGIPSREVKVVGRHLTRRTQTLSGRARPAQAALVELWSVTICAMARRETLKSGQIKSTDRPLRI